MLHGATWPRSHPPVLLLLAGVLLLLTRGSSGQYRASASASSVNSEPEAANDAATVADATAASIRQLLQAPPRVPLARDVGTPPSYDWDSVIEWANDPLMTPMFEVLKQYNVPAASITYLLNPSPTAIPYNGPTKGRPNQLWWSASFGVPFNAAMRVASVSKPLVVAIFENELPTFLTSNFYTLWTDRVGRLPEPLDARVKQITVRQLLDHTGGFDNSKIGFDPAFKGTSITAQIGPILRTVELATDPGTTYSYSNFSYMILARLAVAITGRTWQALNQRRLPAGAPIFAGSDTTPAAAISGKCAAEPSLYWIQSPDTEFSIKFMAGNGNIVSNSVTLAWYACRYWIGGEGLIGKKFSAKNFQPGFAWLFNGSMPGTLALLAQYTTPAGRVGAICIIIPTRMSSSDDFLSQLNNAVLKFQEAKFGGM